MTEYFRPLTQIGPARPANAVVIAGGWSWFTDVEILARSRKKEIVPATELPEKIREQIAAPRFPVAGLALDRPRLMGILNVTPDSFSDGGDFEDVELAVRHGRGMVEAGADIIDIGGESTRPGAVEVSVDQEIARTQPVIVEFRRSLRTPISIDTRKAPVARSALGAGAQIINDVSALGFDPQLAEIASENSSIVCLMHALGDPETMQVSPRYDNVLLDVWDYLDQRISFAVSAGISRSKIIVDPGIGFGKSTGHNLALLQNISLFHTLGCPILLGASRKKFIGILGNAPKAQDRVPGSMAVALAGFSQGVQIMRVHDIFETKQALALWSAATGVGQ